MCGTMLPFMWVLGSELRPLDLYYKHFYPLSCLSRHGQFHFGNLNKDVGESLEPCLDDRQPGLGQGGKLMS